ncbi:MAG: hypothetical protein V7459_00645 [Oceanicoccus sp.]
MNSNEAYCNNGFSFINPSFMAINDANLGLPSIVEDALVRTLHWVR